MSLRKALAKLDEAIEDLTSLHVKTYTGTIKLAAGTAPTIASVQDAADNAGATVQLAVETLIRFDGDTINFVSDGASDAVRTVHSDAVDAGMKTRQGLLELVTDWVG